jgi:hypothetical protein
VTGGTTIALTEAQKRRTGSKLVVTALALVAAGTAAALALNDELRESVLGSAKALGEEISAGPAIDGGAGAWPGEEAPRA